ncbi:helicase C-terminal domain-containing protein [Gamsiella multidivaricata]|uniref:helicase C-terminal domain-containing protein n=1 Tax=Gamsiella multidivaricata TaxID=101098 RepID=UPI0022208E96|nr:helicase C-terminal domain-containing protein [Gamsiella multidivaricata]KAG0370665.1 DEAD H (Asp-Glu-Ala-Asp His) box helicase 11 [Gamsiella multidivaricata]KAI7819596.1 helicase C-terminal domain-containing protein [Gamsiella multidivaricata]
MNAWDLTSSADLERQLEEEQDPLPIPESFPAFPYATPYVIQTEFMQQLFECIDRRKVGIFESPTGTGKSLSMICGAVSWLIEHERAEQEKMKLEQEVAEGMTSGSNVSITCGRPKNQIGDTPDWVQQHRAISDAAIEREERQAKRKELEARVQKIRDRERKMRENLARKMKRQAAGINSIRPTLGQSKKKKGQDSDDDDMDDTEFLVDEYDSDDNQKGGWAAKNSGDEYGNVSKEVLELLKSFDAKEVAHGARRTRFGMDDEDLEPDVLKIYYCSRTHSQLSQFIDELRKTSYGEHLHVVSLGSRKSLCINDRFRQKATVKTNSTAESIINVNKLNDACLDGQKSGTPSMQRCEFLHVPSASFGNKRRHGLFENSTDGSDSVDESAWWRTDDTIEGDGKLLEFRDHTLARVRDIEELAELGAELETCPYYGSRQTVRHCQLVTLPYNLLLHASTRESLKLMIKNNILLLDEAHNLINSLLQMHSVGLSLQQIVLAQEQLQVYLSRYEKRLSSTNEGYIRVLLRILKCLEGFIHKWTASPPQQSDRSIVSHQTQPAVSHQTQPAVSQQGRIQEAASGRVLRPVDRVMKVNEFLHDAGMDHINLFKAHAYLETSGVARKLQGLHESLQRQEAKRLSKENGSTTVKIHQGRNYLSKDSVQQPRRPSSGMSTTPILLVVDAFLMSLLNADNDGRVIVTMEEEGSNNNDEDESDSVQLGPTVVKPTFARSRKPTLKFMLLNPANVFKPLVDEARSVVLAGGTMEPVSDLLSHLFPYLKVAGTDPAIEIVSSNACPSYPRIHRFSCGHVIPKENLMTLVMEKTPTGGSLELNFANRTLDQIMDGVGQSLVNILGMIPDGVVVFFVSYSYMAQVLTRWQAKSITASGAVASSTIMDRIQARKRVFVEPREASDADRLLKEYQDCIHKIPEHDVANQGSQRGAVLFSVVGGKMSEGINFSDRLGRGVVMVGMPFPNKGSVELQERMRYMDQVQQQELGQQQQASKAAPLRMTAGSEYYENLCMRAVNQSIGRAIRHQGDYAVIVLMDKRYGMPRIRKKLPGWIGSSIETCEQFGPVMSKLSGFFRTKREFAVKKKGGK